MSTKQANMNRNPTGKGGFGDHPESRNNGGRPRNVLKDFQRQEFLKMSDQEKREFLKEIDKYKRWEMAEGKPETVLDGDVTIRNLIELDE